MSARLSFFSLTMLQFSSSHTPLQFSSFSHDEVLFSARPVSATAMPCLCRCHAPSLPPLRPVSFPASLSAVKSDFRATARLRRRAPSLPPAVAAKLMGIAGGLSALAKMPACNVQLLEAKKKALARFSTATSQFRVGYLEQAEIFQSTPPLRTHACRLLASKSTLAARVESTRGDPTGKAGRNLRDEILKKIEKWQEPPPANQLDMAILHYKQAINCDSTFIEAYNNLSCFALQPNHPQALSSLGNIYMDCNMMSVAASFYKATLAVTTGISAPFNNLAIIYKQQTAADGLVNRGNTFKEIGRVTEAIQDYIRAVNIKPTMPEAHANLASAYKDR
ncbi:hypothetical protein ZIOFF_021212 [Zingiber officinale]|uniref:Nop domain-containing protein n=1 Tax=Zingiber officinale TaxID=94328 RepID=A0A8J5H148_ZINOF|nr:hypothetical protein ZIOFF_021212 [Zingiber officinale]